MTGHSTRVAFLAVAVAMAATSVAQADSVYTTLDFDSCTVLSTDEVGGSRVCPGLDGIDVFITDGDARMDVDFGAMSPAFETFFTFNGVNHNDTIEWMLNDSGAPYAAAMRFFIGADGDYAEALVVSKIGDAEVPGCVIGIVDATAEQANGIARGLGAMAWVFDCSTDSVIVVPGAVELVRDFGGANQ